LRAPLINFVEMAVGRSVLHGAYELGLVPGSTAILGSYTLSTLLPFWLGEGILINQNTEKMMSGNPSTITNYEIDGWQIGIVDSRLPSVNPEASYLNRDLAR
jgi:hypothetical protein